MNTYKLLHEHLGKVKILSRLVNWNQEKLFDEKQSKKSHDTIPFKELGSK
jgi:hypothetical protein